MRARMREGKNPAPVVGGSSLLVIFAVLCLTVFAVLSLAQAQADRRLAQNSWSAVTGYYRADCQAQEILSRLRAGERPDGVTAEGEGVFSYACPIADTQTLQVRVRLAGERDEILGWQAEFTADWQADDDRDLWDGST